MTAPEYRQLRAFARIDGALLAVLMIASFACYVVGLTSQLYGYFALTALVLMPFFAGVRLKRFRDMSLGGSISFLRGWAYVCLMFFYGGLLLALAQYAYFAYMDHGYVAMTINDMISTPEVTKMIEQMNMADYVSESMHLFQTMRPIDFALNTLSMVIMTGMMLGMPIAAVVMKRVKGER